MKVDISDLEMNREEGTFHQRSGRPKLPIMPHNHWILKKMRKTIVDIAMRVKSLQEQDRALIMRLYF